MTVVTLRPHQAVGAARTPGPATTAMRTVLAEDTLSSAGLSEAPVSGNSCALFANPYLEGAEEALIVDKDHRLTYVRRILGGGGWEQVDLGRRCTEVVTAVHMDGSVWAFVADDTGALTALLLGRDGTWSKGVVKGPVDDWRNLSVQYLPERPTAAVVYGTDRAGTRLWTLLAVISHGSDIEPAHWLMHLAPQLPVAMSRLACGFDADMRTLRVYALQSSRLTRYSLRERGGWDEPVVISERVVALPGTWNSRNGLGCLYTEPNDAGEAPILYCPLPLARGTRFALPVDSPLTSVSGWQDDRSLLHIYGRWAGVLRVLHQRGWLGHGSDAVEPVFVGYSEPGPPVVLSFPLLSGVESYVIDAAPDSYPSQLTRPRATVVDGHVRILSQDVTTSWWTSEVVSLTSDADPRVARRYVTDVTVLDGFGSPVPGARVTVSAESRVQADVDGTTCRLGPSESVEVVADDLGTVRVRVTAGGLSSPVLHVRGKGLPDGAAVDPAADVQRFLAGAGVLPSHPEGLTAQGLQDAKVGDDWLVPGWHGAGPGGSWLPSPQEVVQSCADVFAVSRQMLLPPRRVHGIDEPVRPLGFVVQTRDRTRAAYRAVLDEETVAVEASTDDLVGLGADAGVRYVSDLVQGIRDGVVTVTKVSVQPQGAVISFLDQLGSEIQVEAPLDTAGDASNVVEALFQALGAGVDRLLTWLSWGFDFSAAWDTKKAVTAGARQLPAQVRSAVDHLLAGLGPGWFVRQEPAVTNGLAALKRELAGLTMNSLQGVGHERTELPAALHQPAALVHPQTGWFRDQVLQARLTEPVRPDVDLTAVQSAWQRVWEIFAYSDTGHAFQDAAGAARDALGALFDSGDPQTLACTEVVAVLEVFEPAVQAMLPLADAIVEASAAMVRELTDAMEALLAATVSGGPAFDRLFTWVQQQAGVPEDQRERLTVAGLGGLLFALPVTSAYTTLRGDAPFPGGAFPVLPPPPGQGGDGDRASASSGDDWASLCMVMQTVGGLARVFSAPIDGYLDRAAPTPLMSTGIAGFEVLALLLGGFPPFHGAPLDTDPQNRLAWGQWLTWSALCLADLGLAVPSTDSTLVTMYAGRFGSVLLTFVGLAQLAMSSVAYAASGGQPLDTVRLRAAVTSTWPTLTALVRLLVDSDTPGSEVLVALKTLADLDCDAYSGSVSTGLPVGELTDPPRFVTTELPPGRLGMTYRAALVGAGGWSPYTSWALFDGRLPAGLQLDPLTGEISGLPLETGAATFVATFSDAYRPPFTATSAPLKIAIL